MSISGLEVGHGCPARATSCGGVLVEVAGNGVPRPSVLESRVRAEVRTLEARIDRLTMTVELLRARVALVQQADGGPASMADLVALTRAVSPTTRRPYGVALVGAAFDVPRATIFRRRRAMEVGRPRKRSGPRTHQTDEQLLEEVRRVVSSDLPRWGYRKVCACLRAEGVIASKGRVLRALRAARAALSAGSERTSNE